MPIYQNEAVFITRIDALADDPVRDCISFSVAAQIDDRTDREFTGALAKRTSRHLFSCSQLLTVAGSASSKTKLVYMPWANFIYKIL